MCTSNNRRERHEGKAGGAQELQCIGYTYGFRAPPNAASVACSKVIRGDRTISTHQGCYNGGSWDITLPAPETRMQKNFRAAAVDGLFYPRSTVALRTEVHSLLSGVTRIRPAPKAMIAPHAGYRYSGAVAASAYAALSTREHPITRVVLLGPAHRVFTRRIAASSQAAFTTPLGPIPLAQTEIAGLVETFDFIEYADHVHEREHSLEVHLPFLQVILGGFSLLPLAVGQVGGSQVGDLLEHVWGDDETLIVISSDLSHYHDYATAQRMDAATTRAIENRRIEDIGHEQACGYIPITGLLRIARQRSLKVETVDLRNSGDTAGPRDRVVGYGAYLFYPAVSEC